MRDTSSKPLAIHVIGDSHSRLLHCVPNQVKRNRLPLPLSHVAKGKVIRGASLAGFRPGTSTLDVKACVLRLVTRADRLVLAFGQVDLGLGYYYRRVVKGEDVTPDDYVRWLTDIYRAFLEKLDVSNGDQALKGVNLTALAPKAFAARYIARSIVPGPKSDERKEKCRAAKAKLLPIVLSEDDQNALHLAFNHAVARMAADRGIRYFDINNQLAKGNGPGKDGRPKLAFRFRTAGFDHHVADTVEVRRMHHLALADCFGPA